MQNIFHYVERQEVLNVQDHRHAVDLGDVLKKRKGLRLVIPRGYATALPVSSGFRLTEPSTHFLPVGYK
jgi:hypothetical protein